MMKYTGNEWVKTDLCVYTRNPGKKDAFPTARYGLKCVFNLANYKLFNNGGLTGNGVSSVNGSSNISVFIDENAVM